MIHELSFQVLEGHSGSTNAVLNKPQESSVSIVKFIISFKLNEFSEGKIISISFKTQI